jgi:hypothetical protein
LRLVGVEHALEKLFKLACRSVNDIFGCGVSPTPTLGWPIEENRHAVEFKIPE